MTETDRAFMCSALQEKYGIVKAVPPIDEEEEQFEFDFDEDDDDDYVDVLEGELIE